MSVSFPSFHASEKSSPQHSPSAQAEAVVVAAMAAGLREVAVADAVAADARKSRGGYNGSGYSPKTSFLRTVWLAAGKIRQNPAKSIEIRPNQSKSGKIPAKFGCTQLGCNPLRRNSGCTLVTSDSAQPPTTKDSISDPRSGATSSQRLHNVYS